MDGFSRLRLTTALVLALAGALGVSPGHARESRPASGQTRRADAGKARKPARATPRPPPKSSASRARRSGAASRSAPKPPTEPPAAPVGSEPRPAAAETVVDAKAGEPPAAVVQTEEASAGVKTYTFGAQEVEGRLRSPQILYFSRRVRAEFEPQPLGHRSFLLELSQTRRHPVLE